MSKTSVRNILYGRQGSGPRAGQVVHRVKRATSVAILAVPVETAALADGALVSAVGSQRRVQALVARGWSFTLIAQMLDEALGNFVTSIRTPHITARRHRSIVAVYERVWNVEPPMDTPTQRATRSRALNYAAAHRWLPPMAWDDIDTDPEPPVAEADTNDVDDAAVVLALAGDAVRLSTPERRECVRRLTESGWSSSAIADLLRCTPRTVVRLRSELTNSASKTTQAA